MACVRNSGFSMCVIARLTRESVLPYYKNCSDEEKLSWLRAVFVSYLGRVSLGHAEEEHSEEEEDEDTNDY